MIILGKDDTIPQMQFLKSKFQYNYIISTYSITTYTLQKQEIYAQLNVPEKCCKISCAILCTALFYVINSQVYQVDMDHGIY